MLLLIIDYANMIYSLRMAVYLDNQISMDLVPASSLKQDFQKYNERSFFHNPCSCVPGGVFFVVVVFIYRA